MNDRAGKYLHGRLALFLIPPPSGHADKMCIRDRLKELAGSEVVLVKDFDSLEATDMKTGKKTKLDMPATSNVLQYFTEDGTKVSIRPSGTEPKIKFYIEVHGHMDSYADYDRANADADRCV